MDDSPYPRKDPDHARRNRRAYMRQWFLYGVGGAFIVFGVVLFLMSPSATHYNLPDLAMGLFFVALGVAAKISGQAGLMRLKGIEAGPKRSLAQVAFWLPWYLKQPARTTPTNYDQPPLP